MGEITWLVWDQGNRAHLAAHGVSQEAVDAFVFEGSWTARRNARYPDQLRLTGSLPDGRWLTVVLEPLPNRGRGAWRPVTAWPATRREIADYFDQI